MAVSDSASSFSSFGFSYDVFLSFRGSDTRAGFTDHLYKALSDRGIRTFIDDAELEIGDEIKPSLVKEIEKSRIAIVVFSKNYASSTFCLEELVCILNRFQENRQLVLPVFYDVDPSDVRNQKGNYGHTLALHEMNFKSNSARVHKWRNALLQAANLGHFKHGDEYEYELIQKIVDKVSSEIHSPLDADHLVGLNYRKLDIEYYLKDRSCDEPLMMGIWGVGGIGKTTLAREVYNSIALNFDAACFLDDVGERSRKHGIVHLQETLLADTVGAKDLRPATVTEASRLIVHRLCRKKVLLVLDDVDCLDQLQATFGGPDWFGSGSRIIITTRYMHLLKSRGVEKMYEVKGLTEDEALELLCWKAFKTDKVRPHFIDKLYRAVTCASGIPLALEVIGSNLYGKGLEEWESTLHSYEQIPHLDILMILKQSYDALAEKEKQLFLDIACFFKGYKIAEVEHVLSAHHDYCLKPHIRALVQKSLIKINERDCVTLHDLIRDMGKEIVRQESPKHPGKRSRLWSTEDVIQVLQENTETSKIQIIILDFPKSEEVVQWDGNAFMKMTDLRTLIIRNGCFSKGPNNLPSSLRVLEWWGYPSQSLPFDNKEFMNMRLLNINECEFITNIPDVSGAPNLEELSLVHCENLVEIHKSVGFLNKLRIMDVEGCSRLQTFPPLNLTSLQHLNLSHCSTLVSFPKILGYMENITHLSLEQTAIRELPCSIRNLTGLRRLELHGCGVLQLPSSFFLLPKLEELSILQCEGLQLSKQYNDVEKNSSAVSSNVKHIDFLSCNISDEFIFTCLSWFSNVKELDLSMNNFTILPACIQECRFLTKLNLDYCMNLREIGGIPPNLETFSAIRCTSLKDLDLTILASYKECCFLREVIVDECDNLQEIKGTPPSIELLSARNCRSLTASCRGVFLNQALHEAGNKRFCFPGSQMPEWFEHCSKGPSISFWFRNKFPAVSICLVGLVHKLPIKFRPTVILNGNKMETEFQTRKRFYFEFPLLTDHILIFGGRQMKFKDNVDEVPSENEWNHAVVSIDVDSKWDSMKPFVVQTGLSVIQQKSNMEDIQFTNPYKSLWVKEKHVVGPETISRLLSESKKNSSSSSSGVIYGMDSSSGKNSSSSAGFIRRIINIVGKKNSSST